MNIQHPLKISIFGTKGTFHHIAAHQYFGEQPYELIEQPTFDAVFNDLLESRAELAVVAVHNSAVGPVGGHAQYAAHQSEVTIKATIPLPIEHNLIVIPGTKLEMITTVRSHPAALAQCHIFLNKHPQIATDPAETTAKAVEEMMAHGDPSVAAIASTLAAELNQAEVLVPQIQDTADNVTTFYVLERKLASVA